MRRKHIFVSDEIYHIINRGILRNDIFNHQRDYYRFFDLLNYYRYADPPMRFSHYYRENIQEKINIINILEEKHKKLVEIICYCFMPNHFHLLIKQLSENGISIFMKCIEASYVMYYNTKHKRKGTLFESSFKSVHIEDDEQLVHVSRYIHLNPVSAHMFSNNENKKYLWSSYKNYLNDKESKFLNKSIIRNYFQTPQEYDEFVLNNAKYQKELQDIKRIVLE